LFEYAVRAAGGVDELMVSHADRFFTNMPVVTDYAEMPHIPSDFFKEDWDKQEEITRYLMSNPTPTTENVSWSRFLELLEAAACAPVRHLSFGKTAADKVTVNRSVKVDSN
jgi:hypothetical protein